MADTDRLTQERKREILQSLRTERAEMRTEDSSRAWLEKDPGVRPPNDERALLTPHRVR